MGMGFKAEETARSEAQEGPRCLLRDWVQLGVGSDRGPGSEAGGFPENVSSQAAPLVPGEAVERLEHLRDGTGPGLRSAERAGHRPPDGPPFTGARS